VTDHTLASFSERTHHHSDFPLDVLLERKAATGQRISVVVPARDEERTVGEVVAVLRALRDEAGLLDQVLVVDGDSNDDTAEVARRAGATVVRQSQVLPGGGTVPGKGEALWKGLAACDGDLVVFVDADIEGLDPRFVTGLLGPLLTDDDVAFVKATYDRPLRVGDELHPAGGGRVTELLARPLLAAFWPELGWLAQPLSGEYAGRRSLLEQLPFVRGYGVELAMLVDIVDLVGAEVIAQVDLGRRVHDHQPLSALGRMSAEILQTAVDRLARQGRVMVTDPLASQLLQPLRDAAGDLVLEAHEVRHSERGPLARIAPRRPRHGHPTDPPDPGAD
jgi:glucosyl-3-phosphoglycerate synthase